MKRGTEREEQALREAWAAREKRQRRTNTLLLGTTLVGTGFMLIAFAFVVPLEFCVHSAGYAGARCTTQDLGSPSVLILLIAGSIMTIGGGGMIWKNTEIVG
jgi:hypothetical protein